MKALESKWKWASVVLALGLALIGGATWYLIKQSVNPIHPALDRLAGMGYSASLSDPDFLKIREMGVKGVEHLLQVIRERQSLRVQFLVWLEGKWTEAPEYIRYPDFQRMKERQRVACQLIATLGSAGRSAIPDLVEAMEHADMSGAFSLSMALDAIGLDAKAAEMLEVAIDRAPRGNVRGLMINMLTRVKPPSERAVRILTEALKEPSPLVQEITVAALPRLEISSPEVIAELKRMQHEGGSETLKLKASEALWEFTKERGEVLKFTFAQVENEITNYTSDWRWRDADGGMLQQNEILVLNAGLLWGRMKLEGAERERALGLLKGFCEKSERVYPRVTLVPSMMDLGLGIDEGLAVCRKGMSAPGIYNRFQAARLMAQLSERGIVDEKTVEEMLERFEVGVRVYGAKVHWKMHRKAEAVLPKLIDALDRKQYQSYYYPEIQQAALTTLKDMGADAAPARKSIEALRTDPNPEVVKLVGEILDGKNVAGMDSQPQSPGTPP